MSDRRTIKIFLSHRYKATAVNLYFFNLLSEVADIQFIIDPPDLVVTDKRLECRMSVTRVERRLRDADAFIGVFPIPTQAEADATGATLQTDLAKASRYLKLETDLAMRAGLPALVFVDHKFRPLIPLTDCFHVEAFDTTELERAPRAATEAKLRKAAEAFAEEVARSVDYRASRSARGPTFGTAGVFLSHDEAYTPDVRSGVLELIRGHGFEVREAPQPPVLNAAFHALATEVDWALVDLRRRADEPCVADVLHTKFVPSIRLHAGRAPTAPTALEGRLFPYDVGYSEDIVPWTTPKDLMEDLEVRLLLLKQDEGKLIATRREAEDYFLSAARRKEVVFLSYSSADLNYAAELSRELKRSFQTVFDYRDGVSITPGQPWLKEIFDKLSQSSIGISVLSAGYFASGNCAHEAQQMVAQKDSGKLWFMALKPGREDVKLPPFMQAVQYMACDGESPASIVSRIKKLHDDAKKVKK